MGYPSLASIHSFTKAWEVLALEHRIYKSMSLGVYIIMTPSMIIGVHVIGTDVIKYLSMS